MQLGCLITAVVQQFLYSTNTTKTAQPLPEHARDSPLRKRRSLSGVGAFTYRPRGVGFHPPADHRPLSDAESQTLPCRFHRRPIGLGELVGSLSYALAQHRDLAWRSPTCQLAGCLRDSLTERAQ